MTLRFPVSVSALLLAITLGHSAQAQQRESVWFYDLTKDGKLTKLDGEVKESINGVEVTDATKKVTKISPAQMVRIDYENLPGVDRSKQLSLRPGEFSGNDPARLASEFGLMLKSASTAPEKAKRYMAFREAYWTGRAAAAKEGKEFDDAAKAAVAKLNAYVKAYPRSWEVWQIARDSARLSLHLGDSAAALASWKTLADNTELPLALRHEALLYHAGLLLRGGDLAAAKAAVMEIKADPRLDVPALKEQLAILIEVVNAPAPVEPKPGEARVRPTDAIAKVEAAINLAKSPVARAAGYNALGDLLAIHKLYRDAMWAYLWVDTVYNQDVDQQLRATSRLVEIFRLLNDDDRAALFEERLAKLR